jgi:hypothetical protein
VSDWDVPQDGNRRRDLPIPIEEEIDQEVSGMPSEQNIEVTVVVSGQPQKLKINVHETLEHLVHEALQKSGNQGQAPSEWELRTEDGRLLDQTATVAAAGIHNGMTLFLSPKAGAGG